MDAGRLAVLPAAAKASSPLPNPNSAPNRGIESSRGVASRLLLNFGSLDDTDDPTPSTSILPAGTKLPSVSASSALQAEATYISDSATTLSHLLAPFEADAQSTFQLLAVARWRALLSQYKLERRNKGHYPTVRQFLFVADELAPSGKLEKATMEILLTRIFGHEISTIWSHHHHLSLAHVADSIATTGNATAALQLSQEQSKSAAKLAPSSSSRAGTLPPFSPIAGGSTPRLALGASARSVLSPPSTTETPALGASHSSTSASQSASIALPTRQYLGHLPGPGPGSPSSPKPSDAITGAGPGHRSPLFRSHGTGNDHDGDDDNGAAVGHVRIGRDPRTGLPVVGPPRPVNWAPVRLDDRSILDYLLKGGKLDPTECIQAQIRKREREAVFGLGSQAAQPRLGQNPVARGIAALAGGAVMGGSASLAAASGTDGPSPVSATRMAGKKKRAKVGNKSKIPADPYTSPSATRHYQWERTDAPGFPVEVAALWRDLWRSFPSTMVNSKGVTVTAMDIGMFAAAWAMLPSLKKSVDPRFGLSDAVKAVDSYSTDDCVTRRELEAILCNIVRASRDCALIESAATAAFIDGTTTEVRLGYRDPAARVPAIVVINKVIGNRAFDTVLGHHPASHPRLPVTYLEMMAAQPLREWILKRKGKQAHILAATEVLHRHLLGKVMQAWRSTVTKERVFKRAAARIITIAHAYSRHRVQDAFVIWRRVAILISAARRMQAFGRIVIAIREMRMQSARIYVATQLSRAFRHKVRLRIMKRRRRERFLAVLNVQKVFRAFTVRRSAKLKAIQRARFELQQRVKADISAREKLVTECRIRLQRWWRKQSVKKAFYRALGVIAKWAREQRIMLAMQQEIAAEVDAKREKRREMDQEAANRWKAAARSRLYREAKTTNVLAVDTNRARPFGSSSSASFRLGGQAGVAAGATSAGLSSSSSRPLQRGISFRTGLSPRYALLPMVVEDVEAKKGKAVKSIATFVRMVCSRARMRKLLVGRVERRYEYDSNSYYYVDLRDGLRLPSRPVMLGPRHELAIPDLWVAKWDPRLPSQCWYFNMRFHVLSWDQPSGTIMCSYCNRAFISHYCFTCNGGYCGECHSSTHVHFNRTNELYVVEFANPQQQLNRSSPSRPNTAGSYVRKSGSRPQSGAAGARVASTLRLSSAAQAAALALAQQQPSVGPDGRYINHSQTMVDGGLEKATILLTKKLQLQAQAQSYAATSANYYASEPSSSSAAGSYRYPSQNYDAQQYQYQQQPQYDYSGYQPGYTNTYGY